ncbi:TonB-dependent siderophore receptor [Neogemmobacter tilapiae]|uniref:Ligand-gated channel protein n=1 Tax=Neogemmobacter tilapiae TaxID=875041 RepID=A0A918TSS4_9RHOB|nr:TonB-dependent siderophore receptor [Gemmobacter tilapiae]GHC60275.1 ligand-gated channel protein [Gemmobacter tilapiae]
MASLQHGPAAGRPFLVRLKTLLLSGTAMLFAQGALGQTADEGEIIDLEAIYVHGASVLGDVGEIVAGYTATGTKTAAEIIDIPAQVSVVTKAEMDSRAPDNLMQALSYTSSVSVDEYGSDNRYDYYRIRGFLQTSSGTYRDGLPLRTFNFTGGKIEPYSVQRIEILKGSTSTLFGMNGPGGLVNVITKRPQEMAFGETYLTFGDHHGEVGVDFGAPLDAQSEWTYRITGKVQNSDQSNRYQEDDRLYLAAALSWNPTEATSLTLLANYYDLDGNTGNSIPVGSTAGLDTFFGEPSFNDMDRLEKGVGYEFSHDFGNGLTFRQNARQSNIEMLYEQVYLDGSSPTGRYAYLMNGEIDRLAVDTQLEYESIFGNVESRTLVGLEYTDDDLSEVTQFGTAGAIDPNNPVYCGLGCIAVAPYTDTQMTQKSHGLYLQEELTFDDAWILTLGGRYDRVKTAVEGGSGTNSQSAFTKRLGLTWKASDDLALYANYSESFDPLAAGYVPLLGTAAKPQEGRQYEIGAKYRPEGSDSLISLALFDLSQTNVPRYENLAYWQIGQIDVKGAELEGRMAVNDRLNLNFAWSFWDAEIVGGPDAGHRPQLTPEQQASIWAEYTLAGDGPLAGLRLGGGGRLLGSRFADDANSVKLGSAVVFDAMASYPLNDSTEIAVNVSNLFDRSYVSSLSFDQSSVFYGDGRTVKATLRHRW